MTRSRLIHVWLAVFLIFAAMAAGCQSGKSAAGEPSVANQEKVQVPQEPITLKVWTMANSPEHLQFQSWISDPVKKKYPYITLQEIPSGTGNSIEELVAAKSIPDIIITTTNDLNSFGKLGLATDLSQAIKKYRFDTSRLD
ncbi:MAG: transporter substrate-binding protein, partial [Paenibacillaceae bacterium]|nr:transporter substrate-binding protein [Paenibacillaceae bacterium]